MARETWEERKKRTADKRKADNIKRKKSEAGIKTKVKKFGSDAYSAVAGAFGPSEQKKRNAEKAAKRKADAAAKAAAKKAKKTSSVKKDTVKKDSSVKKSDKKRSGVRTYEGTGYKKQTVTPSSTTEKKIDRDDPATRKRLKDYGKDPDTGHVGIQSLFGGKKKSSTTKTDKKTDKKTDTSGDRTGFGAAFKAARKKYLKKGGPKTFDWKDSKGTSRKYHTRWKDESEEEQLKRKQNKMGGGQIDDYQTQLKRKYGGKI